MHPMYPPRATSKASEITGHGFDSVVFFMVARGSRLLVSGDAVALAAWANRPHTAKAYSIFCEGINPQESAISFCLVVVSIMVFATRITNPCF